MRATRSGSSPTSLVLAVLAGIVVLSGCTASGAGWIPSNVATAKATFGFSFRVADDGRASFTGSYHDPRGTVETSATSTVDVRLKGSGKVHSCNPSNGGCVSAPPSKGGCIGGSGVPYTSQNPSRPGSGTLTLVVCDLDGNRTPTPESDTVFLQVDTGPYAGYTNSGNPRGNVTVRS